jgi:hypothetical protein
VDFDWGAEGAGAAGLRGAGHRADAGAEATQTRYRAPLMGRKFVVYSMCARAAVSDAISCADDAISTTLQCRVRRAVVALSAGRAAPADEF